MCTKQVCLQLIMLITQGYCTHIILTLSMFTMIENHLFNKFDVSDTVTVLTVVSPHQNGPEVWSILTEGGASGEAEASGKVPEHWTLKVFHSAALAASTTTALAESFIVSEKSVLTSSMAGRASSMTSTRTFKFRTCFLDFAARVMTGSYFFCICPIMTSMLALFWLRVWAEKLNATGPTYAVRALNFSTPSARLGTLCVSNANSSQCVLNTCFSSSEAIWSFSR